MMRVMAEAVSSWVAGTEKSYVGTKHVRWDMAPGVQDIYKLPNGSRATKTEQNRSVGDTLEN